tara:strand:+ start:11193 stop:12287 length:1095 start_codon:yes stop_codon:yes gene_type:complete
MIVNSHNEWDQLEEVIVGDGFPTSIPALDFSFKLFFNDNILGKKIDVTQYINKRHVEEHSEDIEKYVKLLESLEIIVKRPKRPIKVNKIKSPHWDTTDHPALNVRDLCMIVGDTIIETPPSCRWRIYENDYMKHLFLNYFKNGCKWLSAPRPLLLENSFDTSYIDDMNGLRGYHDHIKKSEHYMDHGHEIMFDAANCVRLGRHILMNVSNKNNYLGAKWLQNTVGDNYKVITTEITDSHIDSSFLPLKPGVALVMREDIKDKLPNIFKNWDLIYIPLRDRSADEYNKQEVKLASPRIELNVLSINKELIICHPQYESILNRKLKKHNIQAIGTPFRHCELFSGAHHCTTLDIRRQSVLEDYFNE